MMGHRLEVALERVRWKLLRAYQAMAERGAITQEQLLEVGRLLEHIDDVPVEELRARLMGLAEQARSTGHEEAKTA